MKEKIVQESIRLFAERGFKETSIQEITDALNVTKGTFYYYFKNKEQLLMDIHLSYIDHLLKRQSEILADGTKNHKEKIYDMIYVLISDIKQEGLSAHVFIREMRHLSSENMAAVEEKRDEFKQNIERTLKSGMQTGEFRKDLPADFIALAILGMTNWSYFWFDPEGRSTDEEVSRIFQRILLEGIQAD
ncbi:TetR/AcrR family transcriptional regulator [Metabacillus sp. GX 13764]|uniref:TetR/AcrR family transcriptional regulator n=1 Tax=Metabacillus kandeliae TaxID=2900151 RepID=UPI001E3057E2|nr:TetR/AcrR family transcriptional regulator [Metabacillus kandeliae]MCD7032692.1 TetR/AcrR family transcriptional regulator [Metabacillus kandeliae]